MEGATRREYVFGFKSWIILVEVSIIYEIFTLHSDPTSAKLLENGLFWT